MSAGVRVLLVEDDPSLQRFVALALEDQDVRLVGCTSVDEALRTLATHAFDLIITDLMLPNRTGQDLLVTLQDQPALRGPAMLAVFSAGLNGAVRQQLAALGAQRFLVKPCSLAELRACVDEARAALAPSLSPKALHAAVVQAPGAATTVGVGTQAQAKTPDPSRAEPSAQVRTQDLSDTPTADAVETFFGGNTALHQAFLERCKAQFPKDLAQGRDAAQRGDAQTLRHLAHSLKSVLTTLGYPTAAATARALEDLAHRVSEGTAPQVGAARVATDADAPGNEQALRDGWSRLDAAVSRVL